MLYLFFAYIVLKKKYVAGHFQKYFSISRIFLTQPANNSSSKTKKQTSLKQKTTQNNIHKIADSETSTDRF
jgi:hypothetical protein